MSIEMAMIKCPICGSSNFNKILLVRDSVPSYYCSDCKADIECYVTCNSDNKKLIIGMLKNKEYWNLKGKTILEQIEEFKEKDRIGIKPFVGYYPIEEISSKI